MKLRDERVPFHDAPEEGGVLSSGVLRVERNTSHGSHKLRDDGSG